MLVDTYADAHKSDKEKQQMQQVVQASLESIEAFAECREESETTFNEMQQDLGGLTL